jgi:hypothetical protein
MRDYEWVGVGAQAWASACLLMHDLREKVTKLKMWVLIFSTIFISNISRFGRRN